MATITIEVVAGANTMTRARTISAPNLVRFVSAYRGARLLDDALTDAQVLEIWADEVFQQARDITRQVEMAAAARGVSDIDLTS